MRALSSFIRHDWLVLIELSEGEDYQKSFHSWYSKDPWDNSRPKEENQNSAMREKYKGDHLILVQIDQGPNCS